MPPSGRVASLFSVSWMRCIFLEHLRGDRGAGFAERGFEVGHRDLAGVEPAAKRGQAGAADQVLEVGAGEALGPLGERFEIDVVGQRHVLGVDREDPPPPGGVGRADIDQLVEAARAEAAPGRSGSGRLVAPITTTFCSSSSPSISARMVLTTRSVTCGSPSPPPRAGHQAVELVDEDDGRRDLARAGEQAGDLLLALAIPFATAGRDDLVAMKLASLSRAAALASRVLPVPGGP